MTDATHLDAAARLERIAALQRRITEHLNAAGDAWTAMEADLARECDALEKEVRADRTGRLAREAAAGCAAHRINTGDISSRLVDAIEARADRVFPAPYRIEEPRWALVCVR